MRKTNTHVLAALLVMGGVAASAQTKRPIMSRGVALDLICGVQASLVEPPQTLKVAGGAEARKALFSAGDAILVNAGTAQGLRPGQHFYARRVIRDRFAIGSPEAQPHSIHTAGWVTIVEAQADVSVATISETCDGIAEGDYLDPLVLPTGSAPLPAGEPDYARPARVILGDERRQLGSEGSLMVIDRGSDHGLRPGQRLTVFRETMGGQGPVMKLGDAIVTSTQHETSVMRIGATREAIEVGDLIAIHR